MPLTQPITSGGDTPQMHQKDPGEVVGSVPSVLNRIGNKRVSGLIAETTKIIIAPADLILTRAGIRLESVEGYSGAPQVSLGIDNNPSAITPATSLVGLQNPGDSFWFSLIGLVPGVQPGQVITMTVTSASGSQSMILQPILVGFGL